MSRYGKGARSERELISLLSKYGYFVVRAAGSGTSFSSPDVLALKREKKYAIECKAWNKNRVALDIEKLKFLKEWEDNTGIKSIIAWKLPYEGWRFVHVNDMERNEKSYSITRKRIREIGKNIKSLEEI